MSLMQIALEAAERAALLGEVPVGAVVAIEDRIITVAGNERESARDPSAHAELIALRRAARILGRWRLSDVTVYVTLEPCAMCAGLMVNARVMKLVYGADDPKAGAVRTLFRIADDPRLNHRVEIVSGVEAEACGALLQKFFKERRRRDSTTLARES